MLWGHSVFCEGYFGVYRGAMASAVRMCYSNLNYCRMVVPLTVLIF